MGMYYATGDGCPTALSNRLPPRVCGDDLACGGRLAGVRCCSDEHRQCRSICPLHHSLGDFEDLACEDLMARRIRLPGTLGAGTNEPTWCFHLDEEAACNAAYTDPILELDVGDEANYAQDCSSGCRGCGWVGGKCRSIGRGVTCSGLIAIERQRCELGEDPCFTRTLREAVAMCAASGQRLCMHDELADRCCATGCGLDSQEVWMTIPTARPPPPRSSEVRPGSLWLDTDGNHLRAFGAGLYVDAATGETFLYGADSHRSLPSCGLSKCRNNLINVYSSFDLINWDFRAVALKPSRGSNYADRPKVLFSSHTGLYVMWFKSTPEVGVAIARSPIGPFSVVAELRPFEENHIGDIGAMMHPVSGRGWLAYSCLIGPDNERVIRICEMDSALTNLTGIASTVAGMGSLEAPALFYEPATAMHFLWTSHTTGWRHNAAKVFSAASLGGPWRLVGNPTASPTSHESQARARTPDTHHLPIFPTRAPSVTGDVHSPCVLPVGPSLCLYRGPMARRRYHNKPGERALRLATNPRHARG